MLTRQRILHLLHVDVESGKLFWKNHEQRPDLIGQEAGHINEGYRRLSIDGHEVYASQIIWFIRRREWPKFTLDHRDTDKLNDSISNLRKATKAQNAFNSAMNARNTSGFKGVSFCRSTNKWRASIRIAGREKNLGRYHTPEEAHAAWYKAACELHGEEFVRAA